MTAGVNGICGCCFAPSRSLDYHSVVCDGVDDFAWACCAADLVTASLFLQSLEMRNEPCNYHTGACSKTADNSQVLGSRSAVIDWNIPRSPLLGSADRSSRRGRVRHLIDFFHWAARMCSSLGPVTSTWRCSTAFSGIGCPQLAGHAFERCEGRRVFVFLDSVEKDRVARGVLAGHSAGRFIDDNILGWLPASTLSRLLSLGSSEL